MPLKFRLCTENIGTWFMQRLRYLYSSGGHNLFQSGFYHLFDSALADTEISGLIFLLRIIDKKKNVSNQGRDHVHLIPYTLMQHLMIVMEISQWDYKPQELRCNEKDRRLCCFSPENSCGRPLPRFALQASLLLTQREGEHGELASGC